MDNGKTFVDVFTQFGTQVELLPDTPESSADPYAKSAVDVDLDMYTEAGEVDEVAYFNVDIIHDQPCSMGLNLQVHRKCAVNTFNLEPVWMTISLLIVLRLSQPMGNLCTRHRDNGICKPTAR